MPKVGSARATSAPASSRAFSASIWSLRAAVSNGVRPYSVSGWSVWPCSTEEWRGVIPWVGSAWLRSAPASTRTLPTSTWPLFAHAYSGVTPLRVAWFTSAPADSNILTSSRCPWRDVCTRGVALRSSAVAFTSAPSDMAALTRSLISFCRHTR
eukprot:1152474-Prorocentrum_minimum.AAC.3